MHTAQSVRNIEMHKIPWDFEIQADHLTSGRRPGQLIVNKKRESTESWTLQFWLIADLAKELKKYGI